MKIDRKRFLKKVTRILRVVGLVFLVMLACTGMGLTGAAPLSTSKRQSLPDEIHVEMLDKEEKEDDKESEENIS